MYYVNLHHEIRPIAFYVLRSTVRLVTLSPPHLKSGEEIARSTEASSASLHITEAGSPWKEIEP